MLRKFLAPNASPMTLSGTVTYLVGARQVAVIDPGSADPAHIEALAQALYDAVSATILLTHDHPDHSTGAAELAAHMAAQPDGVRPRIRSLAAADPGDRLTDGLAVATDAGELVTLATPGHCPDHAAFHWPAEGAVFCGDLMMGGLDTAVVAAPEGDVGQYLASLERLRSLAPQVIYPAHGPEFTDPEAAIGRYVEHRGQREAQVLEALAAGARDVAGITDRVYGGGLDPRLRSFAESAVEAYLAHLRATGRLPAGH